MKTRGLKIFLVTSLLSAVGAFVHLSAQSNVNFSLSQFNLEGATASYAPEIDGLFLVPSVYIIDPLNPSFEPSQTTPLTQISFGIVNPPSSDFSGLRYDVGIDGFSNLIPVQILSVENSGFTFANTGMPVYVATGNLETPVVLDYGNHTISIIDEAGSSASFVGYGDDLTAFEISYAAAPEPPPLPITAIASMAFLISRGSIRDRTLVIALT